MNYTDYFARNTTFLMNAVVYSPAPLNCTRKRLDSSAKLYRYKAELGAGTSIGFIFVLPNQNVTALTFRSTLNGELEDAWERYVINMTEWRNNSGRVSGYFNDSFTTLWEQEGMKEKLRNITKRYKNLKVWINGHSLGGALASLAAFSVIADNITASDKVTLLTLRQPRVGDKAFVKAYNEQVTNSFRVVRAGDSMPYLPKEEVYTYHGVEVFYNTTFMAPYKYKVCPNITAEGCSGQQTTPIRLEGNEVYFNRNVKNYGKKCK
ncbi:hypothetical protein Y032_0118g751 [Ancylostoma ceylanicum]|nr:hypothetical protein Y032_0118g751 [Ancylostoma ceylanicum]